MTTPILPSIIAGPAIVTWNGNSYYTRAGVKADFKRKTFKITTDTDGEIDERMKAQLTEVTFQPVGMMGAASTAMAAYYPYGTGAIGKSIFGATNLPLVIVTKFGGANNAGQAITYPRGALTKLPPLRLKATDTLPGSTYIEDPGLPNWLYYGQYTPSPPSSVIWSVGPTFLIITSSANYPSRSLYHLFINLCAGICWPNSACVQCYISLFGNGTNLFPVGPAFTPPFWENYFLSQPADLAASFFFNPAAILGSGSHFYLALKITGGPSSIASGSGSSQVAIAVLHN